MYIIYVCIIMYIYIYIHIFYTYVYTYIYFFFGLSLLPDLSLSDLNPVPAARAQLRHASSSVQSYKTQLRRQGQRSKVDNPIGTPTNRMDSMWCPPVMLIVGL